MMKIDFKKLLPYVWAILVFLVISVGYFTPDVLEGKVLSQGDIRQGLANGQEIGHYVVKNGEIPRWSGALFSGMPTYQITPSYGSADVIKQITSFLMLHLPSPADLVFLMLIGFFILLKALRMRTDLAVLGAIAWAFSSYFFVLIEAGHIWKFVTLAYVPPTIGGIILAYRGRYWLGGIVTAIFVTLQILSNHVQMSYYFLFVIAALVVSFFVEALRTKQLLRFVKASVVIIIAGIIGVSANISSLYHTYEYSKNTIRGKSELTSKVAGNQTASGLERDYITQWSYGISETWTLLIPNAKGGATGALGQNPTAREKLDPQYAEMLSQQNAYWGDQPFTSGPVYVGAFILALFIFALFVVEGYLSWPLFIVTALSIFLSWGKNWMGFTNLFLDYLPMYNKFRAVSSILVVAEFTIPLLALLGLKKIIEKPTLVLENKKASIAALSLTAGISLVFALMPTLFFDFLSQMEMDNFIPQAKTNPQLMPVLDNLQVAREAVFTADAWRSFFVVLFGALVVWLFAKSKIKAGWAVALIAVICLIDMGGVNKRYLNSDKFMSKREVANPFTKSLADEQILQDTDPNYRVFNTTVDPFNDATTSYYHKSVGGYHAAKLRRYQDVIDYYLSKSNIPVLNMLNTKYVIVGNQQGQVMAQRNPGAMGNAWYISKLNWVTTADDELAALGKIDLRKEAVADKRFEGVLPATVAPQDSTAKVTLTSYDPTELKYKSHAAQAGVVVFSEIYYPEGWVATIDGKEAPIGRVNYILRALQVPAGNHEIVLTFKPTSIKQTEAIAYSALVILLLAIIGYFVFGLKKKD
ncbi:MAG: YfhO family protein [Bacteroidales bacterium]